MRFDVQFSNANPAGARDAAQAAETLGAAGLWTSETAHDPFLPLTHAAEATQRLTLGTGIAVAFARSPMVVAQAAWDLSLQSRGRFILGLGTQVKAHITRRFAMPWSAPLPRMREYIESLRAIWQAFQSGGPLRYRGEHYRFGLITPFFNPGPSPCPNIPVYLAAVNRGLLRLAAELCDGCLIHPFHSADYLRQVALPALAEGAQAGGRTPAEIVRCSTIIVATGRTSAEMEQSTQAARRQIAFYASTPAYRSMLELHGWADLQPRLNDLARAGRWTEMGALISDGALRTFAVIAPPDELPYAVLDRYRGLLDRIGYYLPFNAATAARSLWRDTARVFADASVQERKLPDGEY